MFPAGFAAMPRRLIWIFGLLIGVAWMGEILLGNLDDIPLLAAFRMSHLHGSGTMVWGFVSGAVAFTALAGLVASRHPVGYLEVPSATARRVRLQDAGLARAAHRQTVSSALRRFRVLSKVSTCGLGEISRDPRPQARPQSDSMLLVQALAEE